MRRVLLFSLLFVFGLAWACDGTSPTGPGDSAPQLARMSNPTVVPIQGQAEIAVDPSGGFLSCPLAGTEIIVAEFPALFVSEGEISHLGHTTSRIGVIACTANMDGSIDGPGWATHTAANGDELHAAWYGWFAADGSITMEIEFADGTGRFAGATGTAVGGGSANPATFAGSWWLDGVISRVGNK